MESVWSVSKLSTEFVGSRRELAAISVHTADVDATQLNSTVQLHRRCVLGISIGKLTDSLPNKMAAIIWHSLYFRNVKHEIGNSLTKYNSTNNLMWSISGT